jgi:hypothetical protein
MSRKSRLVVTVVSFLALVLLAAPQISAMEIKVTEAGVMLFYDDGVLGDSTDESFAADRAPVKRYNAQSKSKLRVQAKKDHLNVGVSRRYGNNSNSDGTTSDLKEIDQTKAKRVRGLFPTNYNSAQIKKLKAVKNIKSELGEDATREDVRTELDDRYQENHDGNDRKKQAYLEKLRESRQERHDQLEVRSRLDEGGDQELELESNGARARLQRGADFNYDPETNSVTVTTPAGEEKTLNHLPDQALERIQARVSIKSNSNPDGTDLDVKVSDDGGTYFSTRYNKRKKFLGFIDRDITTDVVLDDETGEVVEIEHSSPGVLGRFLDVFTN